MGVTEKAVLYSLSRFSCELSEIRAAKPDGARLLREAPAAFGRLRVETDDIEDYNGYKLPAAFGRLRVETIASCAYCSIKFAQPPSGGCVLKPGVGIGLVLGAASRLRAAAC